MLSAECANSIINFINHIGVYNEVLRFIFANSCAVRVIYHYLNIVGATIFLRASIVRGSVISELELRSSAFVSRMGTGLEGGFMLS
jgi:hypothetical protein